MIPAIARYVATRSDNVTGRGGEPPHGTTPAVPPRSGRVHREHAESGHSRATLLTEAQAAGRSLTPDNRPSPFR